MDNRPDSYAATLRIAGLVLFAVAMLFLGRYLWHLSSPGAHGLEQMQLEREPVQ